MEHTDCPLGGGARVWCRAPCPCGAPGPSCGGANAAMTFHDCINQTATFMPGCLRGIAREHKFCPLLGRSRTRSHPGVNSPIHRSRITPQEVPDKPAGSDCRDVRGVTRAIGASQHAEFRSEHKKDRSSPFYALDSAIQQLRGALSAGVRCPEEKCGKVAACVGGSDTLFCAMIK